MSKRYRVERRGKLAKRWHTYADWPSRETADMDAKRCEESNPRWTVRVVEYDIDQDIVKALRTE